MFSSFLERAVSYPFNPGAVLLNIGFGLDCMIGGILVWGKHYERFRAFTFYILFWCVATFVSLLALFGLPMEQYAAFYWRCQAISACLLIWIVAELWKKSWIAVPFFGFGIWQLLTFHKDFDQWERLAVAGLTVMFLIWKKPDRQQQAIITGLLIAMLFPLLAQTKEALTRTDAIGSAIRFTPTVSFIVATLIWGQGFRRQA